MAVSHEITIEDFETAELFTDTEDRLALINDALASGDAAYVAHAIGLAVRARGMSAVAGATGGKRQTLYKSLSKSGNPTLTTLLPILSELGIQLRAQSAEV